MQGEGLEQRVDQENESIVTHPGRRSRNRKRTSKAEHRRTLPLYQIVTFLWLSFLSYWIFYEMDADNGSQCFCVLPQIPNKQQLSTNTPITPFVETPIHQIEDPEPVTTSTVTPSLATTQSRKLPTIYLLRTREGEGLSAFQKYLYNALDIVGLDVQILEFQSQEKEFFSNGHLVEATHLQQSITLFVFHLTTPKITGTWDTDLYSAIFKKSVGNCVWTSIKGAQPSEIPERPVSPEEITSGVNLLAESHKLEKALQFHTSQQEFIEDNHNKINLDKLRKLIKAKEEAINE
mmetsp:Transcript_22155/g.28280  ORF Transcript_22155/g.28280 Transcript_22155/m.28280 type:complete len:291 (-) Transcript_22155:43-915(-)